MVPARSKISFDARGEQRSAVNELHQVPPAAPAGRETAFGMQISISARNHPERAHPPNPRRISAKELEISSHRKRPCSAPITGPPAQKFFFWLDRHHVPPAAVFLPSRVNPDVIVVA